MSAMELAVSMGRGGPGRIARPDSRLGYSKTPMDWAPLSTLDRGLPVVVQVVNWQKRLGRSRSSGCGVAATGYCSNMTEIVVGYDGSAEAERAMTRAADFAEALSARLVVLSVSELREETAVTLAPPATAPAAMAVPMATGETMLPSEFEMERSRRLEELARRQLEDARRALAGREVEVEYLAEKGEMAERLLDVAERRDADLIIVGTREHGFLERLLHRPVDEAVARRADRDVLLVH
jgi:nucleotide-binding universal stress UspA family protein